MTIVELFRIVVPLALAIAGYQFGSAFGIGWGLLAATVGGISGWFIGPWCGILLILPFELVARLVRFVRTGRWTD